MFDDLNLSELPELPDLGDLIPMTPSPIIPTEPGVAPLPGIDLTPPFIPLQPDNATPLEPIDGVDQVGAKEPGTFAPTVIGGVGGAVGAAAERVVVAHTPTFFFAKLNCPAGEQVTIRCTNGILTKVTVYNGTDNPVKTVNNVAAGTSITYGNCFTHYAVEGDASSRHTVKGQIDGVAFFWS